MGFTKVSSLKETVSSIVSHTWQSKQNTQVTKFYRETIALKHKQKELQSHIGSTSNKPVTKKNPEKYRSLSNSSTRNYEGNWWQTRGKPSSGYWTLKWFKTRKRINLTKPRQITKTYQLKKIWFFSSFVKTGWLLAHPLDLQLHQELHRQPLPRQHQKHR